MKSAIPSKVFAVDLHVLAEHGSLAADQFPPLPAAAISEKGGVLTPERNYMRPDRPFVIDHIPLHLRQNYRRSGIGEQTVLADTLHAWTVCDVIHIIFPFTDQIKVLFQGAGDKLRGVSPCGVQKVITVFKHIFCAGNVPKKLANQLLLIFCRRKLRLAFINFFHILASANVLDVVL